jgi:tetratricopeptide (TPR) repeat protein
MENIEIIVNEGDGRRLTEVEARQAAKSAAATPTGQLSEAEKKERAEIEKKNAEITERNKNIQSGDEAARRANQEGRAALEAKNWDVALAKFDEGIAAVPDYVGSTPILAAGKIIALKNRGFDLYVQGAKATEAAAKLEKYGAAKKEYDAALAAFKLGSDVVKRAEAASDPKDQQARKAVMKDLYINSIEVHRLMAVGQVDTTRTAEAEALINEYLETETDPAKKMAMQVTLGDIMRAAGEFDKAVATYRTVLQTAPDNTEVMASLGLSLVAQGTAVEPPNREQLQEGLNYMQKYADTVSILPTDSPTVQQFKQSVKDTVEYLKTEQKLKAQPAKSAPPRKKG